MPRGRRSLIDFEHWEQRIISTASKWKGWSITKDQRGRVLLRRREASRPSETVTLPRPIVWGEAYESDIQNWAKQLWKFNGKELDHNQRRRFWDEMIKWQALLIKQLASRNQHNVYYRQAQNRRTMPLSPIDQSSMKTKH